MFVKKLTVHHTNISCYAVSAVGARPRADNTDFHLLQARRVPMHLSLSAVCKNNFNRRLLQSSTADLNARDCSRH